MRMRTAIGILVVLTMTGSAATAQPPEDRTAARAVSDKNGNAVITVMGTLKAHMSRGGQDQQGPDQAVQASATVIDSTGLTVVTLSAIDPGTLISKNPAFAAAQVKMATELVDVKLRLPDATEVPAKVVLRDSDLDLLFVRPEKAPAAPMPAVDAISPSLGPVDPVVALQRLQELAGWRTATAFGTIEAVIEKPRRFYLVALSTTSNGLGASIFDLKGQFAGIVTLRVTSDPRHNPLNGLQGGMLQALGMVPVLLPASEIREIAKQATAR
jgi:S1-C subfamily serine protease